MDRFFWTALRNVWSRWAEVLLIVKPETVVSWHRAGFWLYWRWRSRGPVPGRARITAEIQEIIRRMARENPSWGASKVALPTRKRCEGIRREALASRARASN